MERDRRPPLPALLCLVLWGASALASEPAAPGAVSAGERDVVDADWPAYLQPTQTLTIQMLPERFQHRPRLRQTRTTQAIAARVTAPRPKAEAAARLEEEAVNYADRAALVTRLRELDGLRLITFWDSPALTVFFGLSRDGFAGLNIRQARQSRVDKPDVAGPARPDMTLIEAPSILTDSVARP